LLPLKRGEFALDEVLEMLDRTAKRIQNTLEENKKKAAKQIAVYDNIIQSKEVEEEQKNKALMGKNFEVDRLERLSSQLSLLYALQIFAFKVKVLEITVGNISEQLGKSGILEKSKEIEDIKKNIAELKILVEAQYKAMKEIKDDKSNNNLTYIH
jgi:archaellum component FlaC